MARVRCAVAVGFRTTSSNPETFAGTFAARDQVRPADFALLADSDAEARVHIPGCCLMSNLRHAPRGVHSGTRRDAKTRRDGGVWCWTTNGFSALKHTVLAAEAQDEAASAGEMHYHPILPSLGN